MTNDADKLSRALVRMFEGMSRPERRALLHACKHVIPHSVRQKLTESGMPLRGNFFLNRQPMEDPTPALTASQPIIPDHVNDHIDPHRARAVELMDRFVGPA